MSNPFRYYKTSAEVIRLAVMMTIRFPRSLRQVEDLLHEPEEFRAGEEDLAGPAQVTANDPVLRCQSRYQY